MKLFHFFYSTSATFALVSISVFALCVVGFTRLLTAGLNKIERIL